MKRKKGAAVRPPFFVVGVMRLSVVAALAVTPLTVAVLVAEVEEVEEIAERRTVERHVGIIVVDDRVRKIIAAAMRQRFQVPVAFDELQNRDVVRVGVADVPTAAKGRNHNERNARTIAKKVQRLNVAGVIVTASFVES